MRDAARLCGVERVKDDAARPRVQEMMQRIRNSSGAAAAAAAAAKAKAEEAFEKYEATFSVTVAISAAKVGGVRRRLLGKKKPGALFSAVARAHKQESRRLQSKSFLFTYNSDFFGRKLRAVLQARNAKFKGGTSATNMCAWSKYLCGVQFVATVDFDAPDAYLVDENSQWQSRWLMKPRKPIGNPWETLVNPWETLRKLRKPFMKPSRNL